MIFETPGYSEILDLYIAYGMVECLVREGIENLRLFSRGDKYCIVVEEPNVTNNTIKNGMLNALEDMLSLHKAIGRYIPTKEDIKIVSDADFSAGANINNVYWDGIPKTLEKIKESVKKGKLSTKNNNTVPLTLMPTAGKYMPKIYGVKGGNPIKIDDFNYALAWIGFHYYIPYIKVSDNRTTYIHIYAIKPLEELELLEILALKDLKKKINNYLLGKDKFFVYKKTALLYHLTHIESICALEIVTEKNFSVVSYTLEKINNNQSIRAFGEYDLSKLMNFLGNLKNTDFYNTIQFIDFILRSDIGVSITFIDGILYDDLDRIYTSIRELKRNGVKISSMIIQSILEWFKDFKK
ncbi:CRISPR-associated protein Cas8a2/Csa4 [Methanocaldococcus lauensis]|nr:CRISPR-associated protein Cas8a2/Csa4 [Methanocaldococcus lauensis]